MRKITETFYPDQAAVKDEMCSPYLTIISTLTGGRKPAPVPQTEWE